MIELAYTIIIYLTFLVLAAKRLMTYLHVLQQEDYDNTRLMKWIFDHKAFDKRLSFGFVVLSVAWLYIPAFFIAFLIFMGLAVATYLEKDPRKSVKKKLVATDRAKRVFFPALTVMAILGVWCFVPLYPYSMTPWVWVIIIQLIPVVLLLINVCLMPFEHVIQKKYWNEAYEKIRALRPTVIGVTGSFGKTSVKHILGHILSTQARTLITPGSVNTPMGITRIVREQLDESHKYFIVEMGAYGPGSIKDLCTLTPPDYGVITAIGHAHYERFKSLETVSRAKYELAEAVMEKGTGKTIIHERTLKFPYGRSLKLENPQRFVVCGDTPETDVRKQKDVSYLAKDDVHIYGITQTENGLEIKFGTGDKVHTLNPPLYGLHHRHNTVLAVITAMELGIEIEAIQTALLSLPQISHRLEVKPNAAEGYTLIDDAYNSNPLGFRSALDLMTILNKDGRNILITPGMIELGIAHDEIHEQIGQYAAQVVDVAIVVNGGRIPTFVSSFKREAKDKGRTLVEVDSFAEAQKWINDNKQSGDLILIENDLPDMYERIPVM